MISILHHWILLTLALLLVGQSNEANAGRLHVSNLNSTCMRCLCAAATSCQSNGCENGYCGPFYISRIYWADAERFVLKDDDRERNKAWEDCALDYSCATEIVTRYMKKFGMDCNGNGVTDCDDYASIHYNGGYGCQNSMEGTQFNRRYVECKSRVLNK